MLNVMQRCRWRGGGYEVPRENPFCGNSPFLSQRNCFCQPRVARNELPWVPDTLIPTTPKGVASIIYPRFVKLPLAWNEPSGTWEWVNTILST